MVQKTDVKIETSSIKTTKTAVPDKVDEEGDPGITVAGNGFLQINDEDGLLLIKDEDDNDNVLSTKRKEAEVGFLAQKEAP
jgi:hypothetical protein